MDADGSNQTNLTNGSGNNSNPVWSPDGSKIAFDSDRDGNSEIYVMDANGSNQTNLTNTPGRNDAQPDWSPVGDKLTFGAGVDVYTMNADGSNQTLLFHGSSLPNWPSWSPDGTKIAFRDGPNRVSFINADGTNPISPSYPNVNYTLGGAKLSWSPNSQSVTGFVQFDNSTPGVTDIGIFAVDGSYSINLTESQDSYREYPYWSPDGTRISAVATFDDSFTTSSLLIMNADGSDKHYYDFSSQGVPLVEDEAGQWSPDGKMILMKGYGEEWSNENLYSIRPDGTEFAQLTNNNMVGTASWQPIPNTAPVTTQDSASVILNTSKLIDVLSNDIDEESLDGQLLTIHTQPIHGSAEITGGKVKYTPATDYQGSDQLSYQICDSFLLDQLCSTGLLTISVQEPVPPTISLAQIDGLNYTLLSGGYVISNAKPTFKGTASPGAEIKVEIHSDPIILITTTDGSGNWSVAPTFDLPSGEHMVYISATLNGLTTDLGAFGLTIQPTLAETGTSLWMVVALPLGAILVGGVLLASRLKK